MQLELFSRLYTKPLVSTRVIIVLVSKLCGIVLLMEVELFPRARIQRKSYTLNISSKSQEGKKAGAVL